MKTIEIKEQELREFLNDYIELKIKNLYSYIDINDVTDIYKQHKDINNIEYLQNHVTNEETQKWLVYIRDFATSNQFRKLLIDRLKGA